MVRNAGVSDHHSPAIAARPSGPPGREREVLYEQIVLAYREYVSGTIPAVFGGLLIVVVMWQDVSQAKLLWWLAILYVATAARAPIGH